MSVTYFDQLLLAARQVHVLYSDQLVGAAHYIYFVSNHDSRALSDQTGSFPLVPKNELHAVY